MTDRSSGRPLFIVDNSVEGWTGLRYLSDWTEFATSFDIATGYFDIGSLLALDSKWQQRNLSSPMRHGVTRCSVPPPPWAG